MSQKNQFVRCSGDDLLRLEAEYYYIGRYTKRVEGGLTVVALTPNMKRTESGDWRWVFPQPAKKAPARRNARESDDTEKVKHDRSQKPKRA